MNKIKKISRVLILTLVTMIVLPMSAFHFMASDYELREVTVYDRGTAYKYRTRARLVSDLFSQTGIDINTNDVVSHAPVTSIYNGMNIVINREILLNITIDNYPASTVTARAGSSVEQVLTRLQQEKNVALLYGGDEGRTVADNDAINFTSWRGRFYTNSETIPYETVRNQTNSVRHGQSHVRQDGEYGRLDTTTGIVYIGGSETNREVVEQEVKAEPVSKIIDVGLGQLGMLTDVTAADFHYRRRVRMEATAYTAGYCCTGKHPDDPWYRITASGIEVTHGIVAVDRSVIPLGTRLYVEGYGFALAADVGGAIRGYKIDLFMEDLQDALRFGRRHLYVWILD